MSVALVLVEHEGGAIKDATLATVTAAAKLGEVHALVAGQGVGGVADAAAKIAGVAKVHVADDAAYAHQLAENVAPRIEIVKVNEPSKRQAGVKVGSVDELVAKLKSLGVAK